MSKTYKLMPGGVIRSDGAQIVSDEGNMDYREYLEWVAEGNTPDPEFTPEEIEANANTQEAERIKFELNRAEAWLFRMILEVWSIGVSKGIWSVADMQNDELKAKIQIWKTKLDRLTELGE